MSARIWLPAAMGRSRSMSVSRREVPLELPSRSNCLRRRALGQPHLPAMPAGNNCQGRETTVGSDHVDHRPPLPWHLTA